jgi:hypothetical protein
MGSHGTSGIEEMVIGSNTEKNSTLKIRSRDQKKNIQTSPSTICFASDFRKKLKKPFKKFEFSNV